MNKSIENLLAYGPLIEYEVYFRHDGPKFFSLKSVRFDIFLVAICVDETEEFSIFLYTTLSKIRFNHLRSGKITLLESIESAYSGDLRLVTETFGGTPRFKSDFVDFNQLPEAYLPDSDARLNISTPTVPELNLNELKTMAQESMRSIAAIELSASGENLTEFSLKGLGNISIAVQDSIDAIAQENAGSPTDKGPVPKIVTDSVKMSAVGLRAASFVLVIGTDKQNAFMDSGEKVELTLNGLIKFIELGQWPSQLIAELRNHSPRARKSFTKLLNSVSSCESGIGIFTSSMLGPSREAHLSAEQVITALELINEVKPTRKRIEIRRGILFGSNTRKSTFDITDSATNLPYRGSVSEDARSEIDGLAVGKSCYITASLEEEVEFAADDQEGGRKYILLSIRPFSD